MNLTAMLTKYNPHNKFTHFGDFFPKPQLNREQKPRSKNEVKHRLQET